MTHRTQRSPISSRTCGVGVLLRVRGVRRRALALAVVNYQVAIRQPIDEPSPKHLRWFGLPFLPVST